MRWSGRVRAGRRRIVICTGFVIGVVVVQWGSRCGVVGGWLLIAVILGQTQITRPFSFRNFFQTDTVRMVPWERRESIRTFGLIMVLNC